MPLPRGRTAALTGEPRNGPPSAAGCSAGGGSPLPVPASFADVRTVIHFAAMTTANCHFFRIATDLYPDAIARCSANFPRCAGADVHIDLREWKSRGAWEKGCGGKNFEAVSI